MSLSCRVSRSVKVTQLAVPADFVPCLEWYAFIVFGPPCTMYCLDPSAHLISLQEQAKGAQSTSRETQRKRQRQDELESKAVKSYEVGKSFARARADEKEAQTKERMEISREHLALDREAIAQMKRHQGE